MSPSTSSFIFSRWQLPVLLLIVLITTFLGLGSKEFSTRGEAREALVAQGMLRTGDWILPEVYGGGVPSKPPVTHWLISLFSLPGGEVTELTSRLPSAFASLVFVIVFFKFLEARAGDSVAWWSSVVLVTSTEWLRSATGARVDMVLTAFLVGGLLALYRWEQQEAKGIPVSSILLLGAATLTKGPVSIVLPGGIFFLYLILTGRSFAFAIFRCFTVFIPVLLLSSVWYLLAYLDGGDAFLKKIQYENIARFTSSMEDEPHAHGVFYLFGTLLIGLLPWTLPALFPAAARFISICKGKFSLKDIKTWWRRLPSWRQFGILVVVITIGFYSIPSSKRSVYLLPAYPFLALFLVESIFYAGEGIRRWAQRAAIFTVGIFTLVGAVLLGIMLKSIPLQIFIRNPNKREDIEFFVSLLQGIKDPASCALLILPFTVGAVVLFFYWKKRGSHFKSGEGVLLPLGVMLVSLILSYNLPIGNAITQGLSPKAFARSVAPLLPENANILSYRNDFYGLSYYLKRRISNLEGVPSAGAYVFLYERDSDELRGVVKFSEIQRSSGSIVKANEKVVLVKVE